MIKKELLPLMASLVSLLFLGCPNPVTPTANTVVNITIIPGVAAPAFGATPVTTTTETAQYTGTVAWSDTPSTFAASTVYTATITLTAKAGYTLTGVAADFFTVAGATSDTNLVNSGVVTVVFPATGAAPDTINLAAIPGLTAPVTGATPLTTVGANTQYTGTVAWSPAVSNMFISNTVYTATITLTPQFGYTLTGVSANSFTVTGATATNSTNSGVVTATFTQTTANLSALSDVTSSSQIGISLKAVQGGTFPNGTANMTISSLRMSQHEITGEQYAAVMGVSDRSNFASVINNPVEIVSWYHALVFCNKLSIADGLTPVYSISGTTNTEIWGAVPNDSNSNATWNAVIADWSANGYRLPTEAEWQFAALGGNSTNNYTYAGSNTIDDVAWYSLNSGSTTHTVGDKAANDLGLQDMSGNVWEYCWDWFAGYPATAQTDYRGSASGEYRVIRGGSWIGPEFDCTVANRGACWPYTLEFHYGFRVVRP